MSRAYYSAKISDFIVDINDRILGELTRNHQFALREQQRNSWSFQISLLKDQLIKLDGYLAFEYSIPRMGKRVDVIFLYRGIIFSIEFKVGDDKYSNEAIEQSLDYALDLKNFHDGSHDRHIIPMLLSSEAESKSLEIQRYTDQVYKPVLANKFNLRELILLIVGEIGIQTEISPETWLSSRYKPTPTIVEAAQALYQGHSVTEISRSDSGTYNLSETSQAISDVINSCKLEKKKAICFITGVPGAGKTLAGLNIANERHNIDEGEHAVFLSGNGPLVEVLQEALARNESEESKNTSQPIKKREALLKTKAFIQNIHHFRDDAISVDNPPIEHVAIFDEAQRAWTKEQTSSFMSRKKGIIGFNKSEPEFLISVMDRHSEWATIVCLIGGGQEINTGEAGLPEWFFAIGTHFPDWEVYVSNQLSDFEYTNGTNIYSCIDPQKLKVNPNLHLSTSIRSFRSEKLAEFVKAFLDYEQVNAKELLDQVKDNYPIAITRNIEMARNWLRKRSRGTERCGIIASSGAYRLKPYGIYIKSGVDPKNWFLNPKEDIRSSNFLEDVATEFDIQGLELDWCCLAWDANLRLTNTGWEYKEFRGTKWQTINKSTKRRYLLNAYRVLLTRARQGMIIFIPEGDSRDQTRLPQFYDPVYKYFLDCGVEELIIG